MVDHSASLYVAYYYVGISLATHHTIIVACGLGFFFLPLRFAKGVSKHCCSSLHLDDCPNFPYVHLASNWGQFDLEWGDMLKLG